MPFPGHDCSLLVKRILRPNVHASRTLLVPGIRRHPQLQLRAPRAVVDDKQKELSTERQAASDRTRRRLHSSLVQTDIPVQAPCPVLLSAAGKARNPGGLNTVLESYKAQPADHLLPLHGGLPHPDAFPLSGLSLRLKTGQTLKIDDIDLASHEKQYQHLAEQSDPTHCFAAGSRRTAVCHSPTGTARKYCKFLPLDAYSHSAALLSHEVFHMWCVGTAVSTAVDQAACGCSAPAPRPI